MTEQELFEHMIGQIERLPKFDFTASLAYQVIQDYKVMDGTTRVSIPTIESGEMCAVRYLVGGVIVGWITDHADMLKEISAADDTGKFGAQHFIEQAVSQAFSKKHRVMFGDGYFGTYVSNLLDEWLD